jgi:hypothetical protein
MGSASGCEVINPLKGLSNMVEGGGTQFPIKAGGIAGKANDGKGIVGLKHAEAGFESAFCLADFVGRIRHGTAGIHNEDVVLPKEGACGCVLRDIKSGGDDSQGEVSWLGRLGLVFY